MITQQKYDKLKSMLIAQRKKNKSSIKQDLKTKLLGDPALMEIFQQFSQKLQTLMQTSGVGNEEQLIAIIEQLAQLAELGSQIKREI